jgi:hypothetical protein
MKRKDGQPQMPRGVRYICGGCGKTFGNREADCKRHLREVHGIQDPVPVIAVDPETGKQRRLLCTIDPNLGVAGAV